MTDDLLDEATRLADAEYVSADAADMIRVLVERVRAAEAERDTCYSDECGEPCQSWQAMKRAELAEHKRQAETTGQRLGEARGKLDKVREAVQSGAIVAESDLLLAILDGKDNQ